MRSKPSLNAEMTGIKVFISSGLSCPNDIKTYSNIGNGLHWKGSG
jgi:hypothetical protein